MAIKRLEQISCSLNLGLIYSLDYSYSPESGTTIKVYFVNAVGEYSEPKLLPMQKAQIRIGSASFTMYAVKSGIEYGPGRRVAWVEFVDEFFKLSNYYIVWPGRGCGTNVIELGEPVDNRTLQKKLEDSLNTTSTQIAQFTQFPDYQHTFQDFITVLRKYFSVEVSANVSSVDNNGNKIASSDFYGSFVDVLNSWCNFYNLAYFFENGQIKIFNPLTLNVTLPSRPVDAISYSVEQDITSTYGKTACNWFQQEGGEYSLNQTSEIPTDNLSPANKGGPVLINSVNLYALGYEFNLPQTSLDLSQCAAAQYGQDFWLLYNYWQGTTEQNCSWTPRPDLNFTTTSIWGASTASINPEEQDAKYTAFKQYGENIAGRWYLSNTILDIKNYETYTWFTGTDAIKDFTNRTQANIIPVDYLIPSSEGYQVIPETVVNKYYPGVNYVDNRITYYDSTPISTGEFYLSAELQREISNIMEGITPVAGNSSYDYNSQTTDGNRGLNFVSYTPFTFSDNLIDKFKNISNQAETLLKPKKDFFTIQGVKTVDYLNAKEMQEPSNNDIQLVNNVNGPMVLGNTSVMKTIQDGAYTAYYNKIQECKSASSADAYFGFRFDVKQISVDTPIGVTFQKSANNTYVIQRDTSLLNQLVNSSSLQTAASPRSFPTRRVNYTVNYFDSFPQNFLTAGLVGLSISVTDNGVQATYSYSNEVIKVPERAIDEDRVLQNIRNTWLRKYYPKTVIT